MTVYLPHDDGTKDYSDAVRFGDLHVIRRKFIYPDEFIDGRLPRDVWQTFWDAARQYDGDKDYVLPYGDLVQVTTFTSLILVMFKSLRVLRYDRHEKAYMAVIIHDPRSSR